MTPLRIFIAVDLPIITEGFRKLFADQGGMSLVCEAVGMDSVCSKVQALKPDILIVDMDMPALDAAQTIRFLSNDCPETKVLAFTLHADIPQLQLVVDAGAHGYVLKSSPCRELIQAVKTVAAGGIYIDPTLVADLLGQQGKYRGASQSRGTADLSDREVHVVRFIAEGHTNKEIARVLNISIKSVETYKSRSMSKLGLHGRADFVRYALNRGWLRPSDGEGEQR